MLGVILINTGSPERPEPDAVRAYLSEFLMDEAIRPLPAFVWSILLNRFILPRRSVASAEKYRLIWTDEGSPLVAECNALARRLECELAKRSGGVKTPVHAAMLYGKPAMRDALQTLHTQGCDELVAIPLYPQSASSTTGAAKRTLAGHLSDMRWNPQVHFVYGYGRQAVWVDAVANSILRAGFDAACDHLILSYHAVPLSDERKGVTFTRQAMESSRLIAERIGASKDVWEVGFQSPFEDGRRWTSPFTRPRIEELSGTLHGRLFVCCPGFSLDCLETRYDVEYEFRALYAAGEGYPSGREFVYVPCLNATAAHAAVLADVLECARANTLGSKAGKRDA